MLCANDIDEKTKPVFIHHLNLGTVYPMDKDLVIGQSKVDVLLYCALPFNAMASDVSFLNPLSFSYTCFSYHTFCTILRLNDTDYKQQQYHVHQTRLHCPPGRPGCVGSILTCPSRNSHSAKHRHIDRVCCTNIPFNTYGLLHAPDRTVTFPKQQTSSWSGSWFSSPSWHRASSPPFGHWPPPSRQWSPPSFTHAQHSPWNQSLPAPEPERHSPTHHPHHHPRPSETLRHGVSHHEPAGITITPLTLTTISGHTTYVPYNSASAHPTHHPHHGHHAHPVQRAAPRFR